MKYEKWNGQCFFMAAAFSAATFAASFVLGSAFTAVLGPGTSGITTIIITTILVVIGALIINTRCIFLVMVMLYTIFAIPTNMFGPPGLQKIFIGLITGAIYDLFWYLTTSLKLKRYALPTSAAFATGISIVLIFWLLVILNHPRAEFLKKALIYIIPVYAALGFVGALLGEWIYDKNIRSIVANLKKDDANK